MAGNQLGKSVAGAAEVSMHLTGFIPIGGVGAALIGQRMDGAASDTGETTRQRAGPTIRPAGDTRLWGTGYIPADKILSTKPGMGTPNQLDNAVVRHVRRHQHGRLQGV